MIQAQIGQHYDWVWVKLDSDKIDCKGSDTYSEDFGFCKCEPNEEFQDVCKFYTYCENENKTMCNKVQVPKFWKAPKGAVFIAQPKLGAPRVEPRKLSNIPPRINTLPQLQPVVIRNLVQPNCMKLENGFRNDDGYCYCSLAKQGTQYSCEFNNFRDLHMKCRSDPTFSLPHGRCLPNEDKIPSWYMYTP